MGCQDSCKAGSHLGETNSGDSPDCDDPQRSTIASPRLMTLKGSSPADFALNSAGIPLILSNRNRRTHSFWEALMQLRLARLVVVFVLLFTLLSPIAGQTMPPSNDRPLLGFDRASTAAERSLEARFDAALHPEDLRVRLKRLSARPHHIGSPTAKRMQSSSRRSFAPGVSIHRSKSSACYSRHQRRAWSN